MKFSSCITNSTIFVEPFEKILDAFVDAGFDGIDIPGDIENYPPSMVRDVMASYDDKLAMAEITAMINPNRDLINPNEKIRNSAATYIKSCIRTAAELDVKLTHFCFITTRNILQEMPRSGLEERAIKSIKELAAYAEEYDVKLLMEPLFADDCTIVKTCEDAVDLWKRALGIDEEVFLSGITEYGLLQDIFHMHHEEDDLLGSLEKYNKITYHRHIADHPRGLDFSRADTDFAKQSLLKIQELDYSGFISFESFNPDFGLNELKQSLTQLKSLLD